jgi:hypothetical protein
VLFPPHVSLQADLTQKSFGNNLFLSAIDLDAFHENHIFLCSSVVKLSFYWMF